MEIPRCPATRAVLDSFSHAKERTVNSLVIASTRASPPLLHAERSPLTVGAILARLAEISKRPRYAFMVLGLIAEAADRTGKAGPFVEGPDGPSTLRDWIADALLPTAERDQRRLKLRASVARELAAQSPQRIEPDADHIEMLVATRARAVGRANVSRVVSDLVRAGFVKRFHEGYRTDHPNRGGGRNVVYILAPDTLAALRRHAYLL